MGNLLFKRAGRAFKSGTRLVKCPATNCCCIETDCDDCCVDEYLLWEFFDVGDGCACLDGLEIPIVYVPANTRWEGSIAGCGGTVSVRVTCVGPTNWSISYSCDGWATSTTGSPAADTCDPFLITEILFGLNSCNAGDCDSLTNSIGVNITRRP